MTTPVLPLEVPLPAPPGAGPVPPVPAPPPPRGGGGPGTTTPVRPPGRLRGLYRGRPEDPAWVRPALLVLLGATAALYLWDLGASGWANSFYAAAVQAGTKSWKAFFFGSSDAANFITVDKPPASLWVMEISARIFGLNSWSLLVPQAIEGVAAVALLYATVRRAVRRPGPALLAGAVLATTPVAALMFRYDNPDALLVLLLTAGAYATVRALEKASTPWLVLAMAAVGTGFITKMLQAFLVLPAFALVYLLAAPTTLRRRLGQLVVAGVALVVSAGWWVAAVQLTPAADRPYIGGSQDNSLLNLIFGYNGFGRLSGAESGSVGGGATGGSRWGPTGILRFFNADFGADISWLIPAALILTVAALVLWRRRPRTDAPRAALLLWAGWLVVTEAVISLAQGIIHPYYSVAAAPAVGAMVGIGAWALWERRQLLWVRLCLAGTLVLTVVWAAVVLDRAPTWMPWLGPAVVALGVAAALGLVAGAHRRGVLVAAVGGAAVVSALAAPAAYALDTAATPHSGAIPRAGP
ncbi:MAG TPA: glycosyltransferase family 39 protein, partial [Acidimicrobiales bacterium]|nr:glycosyltransferase family 39 protein [Acidimicrobiales bacterium]